PAEEDELQDGREDDPAPAPPVAEAPGKFRDVTEVLPVEPDDEGRYQQDRCNHRQPLHDLVLVVGNLRLAVVARAGQEIPREIQPVGRAKQLVVGVAEVQLDVARQQLRAFADVDPAVDDRADRVPRRGERSSDVEQVVPEVRDPASHLRRRPRLDPLLELVDLVVKRVDEVQEVLGNHVDDVVDDHAGALVVFLVVRQLRGAQVAGIAELRRLPDRDDTFTGRNEVDFLVEDPILLADGHSYQEDAVYVVVVALQPWPL